MWRNKKNNPAEPEEAEEPHLDEEAESSTELFGNDDSVEQCLAIMREISTEQRARMRHLDSKTGALAGFAATVFTLNATLGGSLVKTRLPQATSILIEVFFAVSVIALGSAAVVAVWGVLGPMDHDDVDDEVIDDYANRPKVITPPAQLRVVWLQTLAKMTTSDRQAGSDKAGRMKTVVRLMCLGLVGVAAEALTLAFGR